MQRLGIVDLGSNTARLVVFSFEPGKWFRLVEQIREPVRLGQGLGKTGHLDEVAQIRTLKALELFSDYTRSTGVTRLEVLATSALREARNRDEFLHRIEPLGLPLSILTGEEEARLGVLAVANGFEFSDAWIVDLGGGSAQVSLMSNRQFDEGAAYPLGAVRLTERFLRSDPPRNKEIRQLEAEVAKHLEPVVERIRNETHPLVAMGGTVRNLARAVQKEQSYPLMDRLHGFFLDQKDFEEIVGRLLEAKSKKRGRIPGIKEDRADIIVGGALTLRWLLRQTGAPGFWISGLGLREGALFRRFLPPPHLVHDLRGFSVQNLLHHYAQSKENVRLTRRLANSIFAGLRPIHEFGPREANLLDAATVLQDIGLAVNYYRHDKHGEYLVSAAPLNGFTHREQALLALLVRYHLRGKPRLGPYAALGGEEDTRLLWTLAACLRIADHLERSRAGRVEDIVVEHSESEVILRPVASKSLDIELWELAQHQEICRLAFGRDLVVKPIIRDREVDAQD